jgi:hypothetical protein
MKTRIENNYEWIEHIVEWAHYNSLIYGYEFDADDYYYY